MPTRKRPASPSSSSPKKRPKPPPPPPHLLLHQRLNAVQEALSALSSLRPSCPIVSSALSKVASLGSELESHFQSHITSPPGGESTCPAVGCGLKLSKTCHLRRHVRNKAAKCSFHAEVLKEMNERSCRFCGRTFGRREDVTRHEGRCGESPCLRGGGEELTDVEQGGLTITTPPPVSEKKVEMQAVDD
ncbi:hypothetical protein FN846DRAFT_946862, partial [Sphaerosporella brunnea]